MSAHDYDDPEERDRIEERMFRVQDSHEQAVALRNRLAGYVPGRIITNRHPGSDHFHIEMDQDVAVALLDLIGRVRCEHFDGEPPPLSPTRPTT